MRLMVVGLYINVYVRVFYVYTCACEWVYHCRGVQVCMA